MLPHTIIMPVHIWISIRLQFGFYNLFTKYLLVKSLDVSCTGHGTGLYKATIHFPCETYRPCDFACSTLKTFKVMQSNFFNCSRILAIYIHSECESMQNLRKMYHHACFIFAQHWIRQFHFPQLCTLWGWDGLV